MTRNPTQNGLAEYPIVGRYFELLSTVNPVDVKFYDVKGELIADERQVSTGYYVDRRGVDEETGQPKTKFGRFEITTGASEAVKFTVTDGYSGQKSALADVIDRAGRLLGIVYGSLGQLAQESLNSVNALVVACKGTLGTLAQLAVGGVNALVVTTRGIVYGAAFSSSSGLSAATAETVLAAGSNANGVIVWAASMSHVNNVGTERPETALIAKTAAPTAINQGDALMTTDNLAYDTGASVFGGGGRLDAPVFVAAGKGLYFISTNATAGVRRVLYTVL